DRAHRQDRRRQDLRAGSGTCGPRADGRNRRRRALGGHSGERNMSNMTKYPGLAAVLAALAALPARAQEAAETAAETVAEVATEAAPALDTGDTAWMLISTALVLFMILPGVALFYGGLVRTKNMLSILMQTTAIAAMCMILYVLYGYSFAF